MAGAVAFVFGLCALSFAAGCVVTAIMLRASPTEEETAQPQADPTTSAPQPEQFELRWPDETFTSKPIHRNPVVSRTSAALEPVPDLPDPADLADPVDQVELVEEVDELAGEVPELRPVESVEGELAAEAEGQPGDGAGGSAGVAGEGESEVRPVGDSGAETVDEPVVADQVESESPEVEQAAGPVVAGWVPSDDSEAGRFFLAYAARRNSEPAGLGPEVSSEAEPFDLASWFTTSEPEGSGEAEQSGGVELERIVPAESPAEHGPRVVPRPEQAREASSRNGKRREIKLELVPQPSEPEPGTTPEPAPAAEVPAEPETVFDLRSGLVVEAEPEPDTESEAGTEPEAKTEPKPAAKTDTAHPDPEAVVPEQGARAEPVLVPTDEFRLRYLRTFEAARRRSSR